MYIRSHKTYKIYSYKYLYSEPWSFIYPVNNFFQEKVENDSSEVRKSAVSLVIDGFYG